MVLGLVRGLVLRLFGILNITRLLVLLIVSMFMLLESSLYSLGGVWFVDGLSQILTVLALYIRILIITVRLGVNWVKRLNLCVFLICLCLVAAFCAVNVFFFYRVFEGVLIPTIIIILGWGYQPERVQAVVYIVVYTVFGSLPFLYGMALLFTEKRMLV